MHARRTPRTTLPILALGPLVVILLAGCATSAEPGGPGPQPPLTPTPSLQPTPPGSATPVPDSVVARPEVQAAIKEEAERVGVDATRVTVVAYQSVTWPDGSIGCPEPGRMYTQALVPGHRLVLGVDSNLASYHAGRSGPFRYCANPTAPAGSEA